MDSNLKKKHIRQDLQDYLDRRACGQEYLAAGEKNPTNPARLGIACLSRASWPNGLLSEAG